MHFLLKSILSNSALNTNFNKRSGEAFEVWFDL